jgi:hypothetical protein
MWISKKEIEKIVKESISHEMKEIKERLDKLEEKTNILINSVPVADEIKNKIKIFLENIDKVRQLDNNDNWFYHTEDNIEFTSIVEEKNNIYYVVLGAIPVYFKDYYQIPSKLGKALLFKTKIVHLTKDIGANKDIDGVIREYIGPLTSKKRRK